MPGSDRFDLEEIERQLAVKLTMTALQGDGSASASRQVLDVLDRIRSRQAANAHRLRMEQIAEEPVDLAHYLGYLGESVREVEICIGRAMSSTERAAYDEGRRKRHLELRAVELDRAIRGQGKPAPWMRT